MNDRLGSLAWMGGIVLLLTLMYLPEDDPVVETRPLSGDTRPAGLAALERWLERSGIRTTRLRHRFTTIAEQEQGADGNLLIAHVPMLLIPEFDEIAALDRWVAAGNTLVVSASLLESPAWHLTGGSVMTATEELSGIHLSLDEYDAETDAGDDENEDTRSILDVPGWVAISGSSRTAVLRAVAAHPLGEAFENVEVPWDGTRVHRALATDCAANCDDAASTGVDPAPAIAAKNDWTAAIEHAGTGQTAVWERRLGRGHIVVLGHPSLLGNAAIHERGNRQFAMNLIARHLGPDGRVLFDDAHQGENDLYTPRDLLTDIRALQTLGFLLLCWAVYILADAGSWERASNRRRRMPRGQADLVRASGGYLARRLNHHALAHGLLAPLRDRLAKKWRLPADRALEQGLALERANHAAADDLIEALGSSTRRRLNPVRLHNLILAVRREIR